MKFLLGLDLKTILYLLLAVIIVFGFIKKLFKLVIIIALIALAFYVFNFVI